MTSKKHKRAIEDSLSSALEPPKTRRPSPALNDILSQYAPAPPSPEIATDTVGTQSTLSTQGTHSTQSTQSITSQPPPDSPIAPARDFMKMANSIHREAVPNGIFKGKCKQLYDFLYSKTRGAIIPTRNVRLTRREIMRGSGIGSTKTLFLNLRHLRDTGLITWDERVGPHEGNDYTVFLPEEIETLRTMSTHSTQSTHSASSPKVDRVLGVESTLSTHSLSQAKSNTSGESKTSFKTNPKNDDDEAFAALFIAERELTGKHSPPERWREVAELLVAELKIAAGRTTVSSVPAFLAEHLRRRLWKKEKRQIETEAAAAEVKTLPKVDPSRCPDCFGTGMYYPEGFDKGVARCDHKRLAEAHDETS